MEEYLQGLVDSHQVSLINSPDYHYLEYLHKAYKYAQNNSDDDSTQTASIILQDNVIVSIAANGFAPGVSVTKERLTKPLKYDLIGHGERQAVYLAAKEGIALAGAVIITPWVPCGACANSIITSGIKKLVLHWEMCVKTPTDWLKDVQPATDMLLEAGVEIEFFKGKLSEADEIENLFRGEIWYP